MLNSFEELCIMHNPMVCKYKIWKKKTKYLGVFYFFTFMIEYFDNIRSFVFLLNNQDNFNMLLYLLNYIQTNTRKQENSYTISHVNKL